jgi:hypothetical protein
VLEVVRRDAEPDAAEVQRHAERCDVGIAVADGLEPERVAHAGVDDLREQVQRGVLELVCP